MKKILFIADHRPDRSPSQRFRFEQYLKFLNDWGYTYEFSYLLNKEEDTLFYSKGRVFAKALLMFKTIWRRWSDVKKASQFDIIFVQREALLIGSAYFEKAMAKKAKLIYDFDDSIWMQDDTNRSANRMFLWLKNPAKTSRIIESAALVFAGNAYLSRYALQFNSNVVIVPTTIDTEEYQPKPHLRNKESICIGWSGSHTTIGHFEYCIPVLRAIKQRFGERVHFKVIGDQHYRLPELGIEGLPWRKEDELEQLNSIDIGLMPLPDNEWTEGKCGLKGLQYMALGIPTIMSAVGVNKDIIRDGENGFLAKTEEDWVQKITYLIERPAERVKIGMAGLETVLKEYSVEANKNRYKDWMNKLLSEECFY